MPRSRQLTPPFGYRRLFILLREQGEPSGVNRIYRLYRGEGLTVRKRKARRKAIGTRTLKPRKKPLCLLERTGWSYKFAIRLTDAYMRDH